MPATAVAKQRFTRKVGIDGDALRTPLSGVGQYVFNLCRELDRLLPDVQFYVYTRLGPEQMALPSTRWVVRREQHAVARKLPSFVWLKTRGAALARRDELDVFWAGRTIHPGDLGACRIVVTVHDLNHHLVPKTMEWPTLCSHLLWFDSDVRSADSIFANSKGTSDRLRDWVGRSADEIVYPGVGPGFQPLDAGARLRALADLTPFGIAPPYVLAVSTLEPRKNIGALVDAFLRLKRDGTLSRYTLVLVGAVGWQNQSLARKISDNAADGIVLPGYVPDELMPGVFALADVLVMASLYEGFGMPVLEARAMGTPVIVSDVPELLEAAGDHAQVVAPDVASIERALLQLPLRNARQARHERGEIHTWSNSAQRMKNLLTHTDITRQTPD